MPILLLVLIAVFACCVTTAQAKMGLTCSQWLDARAYMRYDARTKQFVDERPRAAPPVSQDVATKIDWATWYLAGHISARTYLDKQLESAGLAVNPANPVDETLGGLAAIDNLCRTGLQKEHRDYDVATLIDLSAWSVLRQRLEAGAR